MIETSKRSRRGRRTVVAASALALTAATAVGIAAPSFAASKVTITVWAQNGQAGEVATAKAEVAAFNKSQGAVVAKLSLLPQGTFDQTIATTGPNSLGDVVEINGETLAADVYDGKVAALKGLLPASSFSNELSSIQAEGTWQGKAYSVSQYDSGLALYGNKSLLAAAGVTNVPTTWQKAWTVTQFNDVLSKLAAKSNQGYAIDLKENYGGEWPGYAFTPVVNSAGFALVKNNKASGSLNSAKVAAALTHFADWKKYTDPNADDKAFDSGRVGLAWVGHWEYPQFAKALGSNLVVIPLPNFGAGSKSGQGSHSWIISSGSKHKTADAKFLQFITSDKWINTLTNANGAVPATKSAIAKSKLYKKGGPLYLYTQQLNASCGSGAPTTKCVTVPRTISPAWPTINQAFSTAFWNIYHGANAQSELNKAAQTIDQYYADNNNFK